MSLRYVNVINFRNFENTNITFEKGVNVFFGNNGQGKTNFTESLFLLTRGKSFRKAKREELIKYNKKEAVIESETEKDKIKIYIDSNTKKTFINEKQTYKRQTIVQSYFINSDLLFYFKNFSHFRIKLIDKLCYNIFGVDFLINYKKYIKAAKNLRNEPYSKVWNGIFNKYRNEVNDYRIQFLKKIKEGYSKVRDNIKLDECIISLRGDEKKELNILRKDKQDLSLGELKSIIFAILYATMSLDDRNSKIFIFDDFNSEWDLNRQRIVKTLIKDLQLQSFIMETQRSEDINFIIEKGEINKI